MKKLLTVPNILTLLRIIGSICLIFILPLSVPFFIIYTVCGISDVLDGTIARATKTTSELGSKLDSIADLVFYFVLIIKIFPMLCKGLPGWIWIIACAVVLIRCLAYLAAVLKYRKFSSLHTYLNKATGFFLFLVPYVMKCIESFTLTYCIAVCLIGGLASVEEFLIHLLSSGYNEKEKSVISIKKFDNSSET